MSLITTSKAQKLIADHSRRRRLDMNLTQAGLADRSGVRLSTLRKFERTGLISLESFLKLRMVLGGLESIVQAIAPSESRFSSIDDVLKSDKKPLRHRGRRS